MPPSAVSQTLVQRLKQQRDRILQVQKQQTSEASKPVPKGAAAPAAAAAAAERGTKRPRAQQQPDKATIKQKRPPQQPIDDDSTSRAPKRQKRTQPAERQSTTAESVKTRKQVKAAPTQSQSTKPTRKPHTTKKQPAAIPQPATDNDDTTQHEEEADEEEAEDEDDDDTPTATSKAAKPTKPAKAAAADGTKLIKNPQVYLDLAIAGQPVGRLVIELYQYASPRTVANFRALCTGEKGVGTSGHRLHYLDSRVHRIDPSFAIQLGDITSGDGTGGDSIYGAPTFPHEPSHRRHVGFGTLSTSASLHGGGGASSTFFIATSQQPLRWLDKRHTVFGRVIRGKQTLLDIERLAGRKKGGAPKAEVTVTGCGSMRKDQKLEEDGKRRERAAAHQEKVKGKKVVLVCPRCGGGGKVNKKTRKGVRVWCVDEECQYCWYEADNEWDEEKKAEFVIKETKRREEEEEKEAEEAAKLEAEGDEEEGEGDEEDEEDVDQGEMDEEEGESDEDDGSVDEDEADDRFRRDW